MYLIRDICNYAPKKAPFVPWGRGNKWFLKKIAGFVVLKRAFCCPKQPSGAFNCDGPHLVQRARGHFLAGIPALGACAFIVA